MLLKLFLSFIGTREKVLQVPDSEKDNGRRHYEEDKSGDRKECYPEKVRRRQIRLRSM